MAKRKRSTLDRYPVTEQYLLTRARAFALPAQDIKKTISPDNNVYGVIVDIPMSPSILSTLVCYANGAANLYYNNGGGIIGAATQYRPVAHAARTLVLSAEQCLNICEKVTSYDLPIGKHHFVYLLARDGVYKTSVTQIHLEQNDKARKLLFFLYQKVLGEIRTAQLHNQHLKNDNYNNQ